MGYEWVVDCVCGSVSGVCVVPEFTKTGRQPCSSKSLVVVRAGTRGCTGCTGVRCFVDRVAAGVQIKKVKRKKETTYRTVSWALIIIFNARMRITRTKLCPGMHLNGCFTVSRYGIILYDVAI